MDHRLEQVSDAEIPSRGGGGGPVAGVSADGEGAEVDFQVIVGVLRGRSRKGVGEVAASAGQRHAAQQAGLSWSSVSGHCLAPRVYSPHLLMGAIWRPWQVFVFLSCPDGHADCCPRPRGPGPLPIMLLDGEPSFPSLP